MAEPDIDGWLGSAGLALDVPVGEVLLADLRTDILGLTVDIAHQVARPAVPLTSFLIGVAVGRGAAPDEAVRRIRELLPNSEVQ